MFGRYEKDFAFSDGTVSIVVQRTDSMRRYIRTCGDDRVEKILPAEGGTIVINPVEPVNLPAPISWYLEINFPPVVLCPRSDRSLYLTFPLEIGVFLEIGSDIYVLDLFSLVPVKYSLYGTPGAGLITRWHRSGVHDTPPTVEKYCSGILQLTIKNTASETIEISRAVFDSWSMHLYYGDYVTMAGDMEVYSPMIARTLIRDTPPIGGMQRCMELYMARKIPAIHGKGYLMEFGVV